MKRACLRYYEWTSRHRSLWQLLWLPITIVLYAAAWLVLPRSIMASNWSYPVLWACAVTGVTVTLVPFEIGAGMWHREYLAETERMYGGQS